MCDYMADKLEVAIPRVFADERWIRRLTAKYCRNIEFRFNKTTLGQNVDTIHVDLTRQDGYPPHQQWFSSFSLSALPSCSAICVSNEAVVRPAGLGIGQLLTEMRMYIAKEVGFQQMMCTTSSLNVAQNHILAKLKWKASVEQLPHNGHHVFVWTKDLHYWHSLPELT